MVGDLMKNKKISIYIYKIIAAIFAILSIVMCVVYFVVFHSGLSHDPYYWDVFGSYFSVIISIVNLVFFIIVTIYVAQIQDQTINNQISQNEELHLLDYKWKRLEDLNQIINDLQSFAIIDVSPQNTELLSIEVWKLYRAVILYIKRNSNLFHEIDFTKLETETTEFKHLFEGLQKKEKEFTQEDVNLLNQQLTKVNDALITLTEKLQNNVTTNDNKFKGEST